MPRYQVVYQSQSSEIGSNHNLRQLDSRLLLANNICVCVVDCKSVKISMACGIKVAFKNTQVMVICGNIDMWWENNSDMVGMWSVSDIKFWNLYWLV